MGGSGEGDPPVGPGEAPHLDQRLLEQQGELRIVDQVGQGPALDVGVDPGLDRGEADFVHLGRGKQLTIHRGQPGCRYAVKPDLVVELEEEPQDLGLVEIEDFDGDGLSDLSVTRLLPAERQDVSAPVVLDLYLSGGPP